MENCIFCKIANKEIPSYTVYEDDICLAFLDINPISKGHTLVISKEHYDSLIEVKEEVLTHMIKVAQNIAKAMMKINGVKGINIINNCKETAGQEVPHFHIHVIPRYTKEELTFTRLNKYDLSKEEFTNLLEDIKKGI